MKNSALLTAFPVLALLMYGALALGQRRSGHVIQLIGAIFASAMPALHMRGRINDIAHSSGGYFFIFTLITLGATGMFGFVLALRGLWDLRTAHVPRTPASFAPTGISTA